MGPARGLGKTKPISGGAGRDEARGTGTVGYCTNKANSEKPGRHPGADCAKRTQFAGSARKGQVVCGKRVMTNWTCPWPGQNEANFRQGQQDATAGIATRVAGGIHRAKQSQFATDRPAESPAARAARAASAGDKRAKQSQFPSVRPRRGIWNRQLRAECGNPPPCAGRTRTQGIPIFALSRHCRSATIVGGPAYHEPSRMREVQPVGGRIRYGRRGQVHARRSGPPAGGLPIPRSTGPALPAKGGDARRHELNRLLADCCEQTNSY
jgi:hypothetical protein